MAAFDGGTYCSVVTEGDVHTTNQVAFGFYLRDSSKTGIYAVCYGAGDEKLGTIAEEDARKAEKPKPEGNTRAIGTRIRRSFESGLPAFKQLVRLVKSAAERGWIKGIDGRKMPVRSPHAALNVRLQNSGAVICKQWGCDANDELQRRGLKHGWDGDYAFVSWSHDEYQIAVRDDPATIAIVREVLRDTGRAAGQPFNFQCPLDVETKVGLTWAETH
jgi:DNA polymerase I